MPRSFGRSGRPSTASSKATCPIPPSWRGHTGAEWGRHIIENLRNQALRSPDPRLDDFVAELEGYLPAVDSGPDHLGFAVPLRLASDEGELRLITTLTSFATAVDVTLSELHLEAFCLRTKPPPTSSGAGLSDG